MKTLNENLEKLKRKSQKKRIQEQPLIQQSKLASMGDDWNIAASMETTFKCFRINFQNTKFSYTIWKSQMMNLWITSIKANSITTKCQQHIDDFRNFYKPNKSRELFNSR